MEVLKIYGYSPVYIGIDTGGRHLNAASNFLGALCRVVRSLRYLIPAFLTTRNRFRNGIAFLHCLEGDQIGAGLGTLRATVAGSALVAGRTNFLPIISDHAALSTLPSDSIGRRYVDFMRKYNLRECDYAPDVVSAARHRSRSPEEIWYRVREGCMHDLRHVVTGYGPDEIGEVCLSAFRWAQTDHVGMAGITLMATVRVAVKWPRPSTLSAIIEAFQRGRNAILLDAFDWEGSLDRPLEQCRRAVGLSPALHYLNPDQADFGGGGR